MKRLLCLASALGVCAVTAWTISPADGSAVGPPSDRVPVVGAESRGSIDAGPRASVRMDVERDLIECAEETFDHDGALPAGWTALSQGAARSQPWAPVQESGSDWAVETTQAQFELPYEEWLISPLFDRTEFLDNTLSFHGIYDEAASSASVRVSRNGGLSYSTVLTYEASFDGPQEVDISALADGEPDVRVAFVFSGEFLTGGARLRVDDVQVCGLAGPAEATLPQPVQPMSAPSIDRRVVIGCTFVHPYGVDGESLEVRYDANGDGDYDDGGVEDWTGLPALADDIAIAVEHLAHFQVDGQALAFEFRAKSLVSELWGYSGLGKQEGIADDWTVWVEAQPPVAILPQPEQPMLEAWLSREIQLGCTFVHPIGVDGASLALRIDANGDGDYADGGAEDWLPLPVQPDSDSLTVLQPVEYLVNGEALAFEFRALAIASDRIGHSGTVNEAGIADDWTVRILADLVPPLLSDPRPVGQPLPDWHPALVQELGVTVDDELSGVDGSAIERRTDWNRDGDFLDAGEDWQAVPAEPNALQIVVRENVAFPADGVYAFEYRAFDVAGNGPVNSGGLVARVDATPPSASVLHAQGSGSHSATLFFSPTTETNFDRYLLSYSTDSTVTDEDPVWSADDDPALGQASTYQTTVQGLDFGQMYWFRLRARDLAGNLSDWSNRVSRAPDGAPLMPIEDLFVERTVDGLRLNWSAPHRDVFGSPEILVEGYEVHSSESAWFEPTAQTRLAEVANPPFEIGAARTDDDRVFFRVLALGGGAGSPVPGMLLVPAGTFTMGPDPWDAGDAHEVEITRPYWLDVEEVDNLEYMAALQWAYDQGLVEATESSVQAHGVELLDLDAQDFSSGEIRFDSDAEQFHLVMLDDVTSYGWGPGQAYPDGYDPALHPVKEVSWYGAACYCDWLSLLAGLPPFYDGDWSVDAAHDPYTATGYRLPTEAEWERAARFDDGRIFPWGNNFPIGCEPLANQTLCVGWTRPVGSYPLGATLLGLLDMTGNVVEWTNDYYLEGYPVGPLVDPLGPPSGSWRVMRGSDFGDGHIYYSETTARQYSGQHTSSTWIGFRALLPTGGALAAYGVRPLPEPDAASPSSSISKTTGPRR